MKILSLYSQIRSYFWTYLVRKSCGSYKGKVKANRKTIVNKNVHLGSNVNFNGMLISKGGIVQIGDNFHSGAECRIIAQNHNINGDAIPYDKTYIKRNVTIKDNVWIGHRVIILAGVTIGEGAIIQAGSVVVTDIPDFGIAGGHPAKVFKYRDEDHYRNLKNQEKFH